MDFVDRGTRVQVLDMPFNKYMSLGKSLNLSKPQLTHLSNEKENTVFPSQHFHEVETC